MGDSSRGIDFVHTSDRGIGGTSHSLGHSTLRFHQNDHLLGSDGMDLVDIDDHLDSLSVSFTVPVSAEHSRANSRTTTPAKNRSQTAIAVSEDRFDAMAAAADTIRYVKSDKKVHLASTLTSASLSERGSGRFPTTSSATRSKQNGKV